MQSSSLIAALALAAAAGGSAWAQDGRAAAPAREVAFRCEGPACAGGREVDLAAQCRRIVRAIGPVSRFRSGGRELSGAELRACNRYARPYEILRP